VSEARAIHESPDAATLLVSSGIQVPDREHALRCAAFAATLFDGLHDALQLDAGDRVLAMAGALFHDAGYLRGGRDHHRKAFDVIRAATLPGIEDQERTVIACAARYHGHTVPHIEHVGFGEMSAADQWRTRRISALVRVAAALDASHLGHVSGIAVESRLDAALLTVRADDEPSVERERLREAAGGFRLMTGVQLLVDIVVERTTPDVAKES
jgi:exopolyphosphatase/guanosine-5'-triphosphate,3'-diphosphate pyrophosphatase